MNELFNILLGRQLRDKADLAREALKHEQPDLMSGVTVRGAGPMERAQAWIYNKLHDQTIDARTSKSGNEIIFFPSAEEGSPESVRDLMRHELEHVKQMRRPGGIPETEYQMPYFDRPHEQDAYNAQAQRRSARRDINLGGPTLMTRDQNGQLIRNPAVDPRIFESIDSRAAGKQYEKVNLPKQGK